MVVSTNNYSKFVPTYKWTILWRYFEFVFSIYYRYFFKFRPVIYLHEFLSPESQSIDFICYCYFGYIDFIGENLFLINCTTSIQNSKPTLWTVYVANQSRSALFTYIVLLNRTFSHVRKIYIGYFLNNSRHGDYNIIFNLNLFLYTFFVSPWKGYKDENREWFWKNI